MLLLWFKRIRYIVLEGLVFVLGLLAALILAATLK